MAIRYLTLAEILRLHYELIEDYGGSHGVRDESRLLAVVAAPRQQTFGKTQYPTIHGKAAVYLRNIIGDHPFVDGNKRTAITACGIFLANNSHHLTASPQDLEDFVLSVVTGHLGVPEITAWLQEYTS